MTKLIFFNYRPILTSWDRQLYNGIDIWRTDKIRPGPLSIRNVKSRTILYLFRGLHFSLLLLYIHQQHIHHFHYLSCSLPPPFFSLLYIFVSLLSQTYVRLMQCSLKIKEVPTNVQQIWLKKKAENHLWPLIIDI